METLRNPMVWAGVVLAGLTIVVLAVGRADDRPALLDGAILTGTVNDLTDEAREAADTSATVSDTADLVGASSTGAVTGVAVVDDAARCLWVVNVSGADSGARHLVAWPSGSTLEWEPFRLSLTQAAPDDLVLESDPLALEGQIFPDLSELDETERLRLLGLDGCPHEAVLVLTDQAGSVRLAR